MPSARRPGEEIANELRLQPGNEVAVIRRVRSADGKPAIYSIDHLPADIIDARKDVKAFSRSLYKLLGRARPRRRPRPHGAGAGGGRQAISRRSSKVPQGTPLQHLKQTDFDAAGRPVMHSLEWHVPSVIELRVYRRGPGPLPAG